MGDYVGFQQNAPTGCRCDIRGVGICQSEWIEQLEKIDEGGHEQFFPKGFHAQAGHNGNQLPIVVFCLGYQSCNHAGCEQNVGIQQQSPSRFDFPSPLFQGPKLAAPALWQTLTVNNAEINFIDLHGDGCSAVIGGIIHQQHLKPSSLFRQSAQGVRYHVRLVAGGNKNGHLA